MGTTIANFNELAQVLSSGGGESRVDAAEQVLQRRVLAPPLDSLVIVRWEKKVPLLQMITPIVDGITPERLADVETAVCRANNIAVVPGFTIDYAHAAVTFRITYPVFDGITNKTLDALFETSVGAARDYVASFRRIVKDGVPGESINDLAEIWIAQDPARRKP